VFDKKWIKPMALAMGLPSTALASAWFLWTLVDMGYISDKVAIIIFLAVIFNVLITMVVYAYKKR
jgi:Kef-type K+ transport system membrane component KefB